MRSRTTRWASWETYRKNEQPTVEIPGGGDLPSALFFPADYSVGMANLGYHYIFRGLRERGVAVERFFSTPIPYRSVDRDTLFERFSLFLASVSYEGDVPVFAKWLAEGGIAPSRFEREDGSPLVGAGGAVTYINPLMLTGICDFILLGDGLPLLSFLVETLRKGVSREAILRNLAEHPSILVPSVHLARPSESLRLSACKEEDISTAYGYGNWVTRKTAFGSTLLVELQRGCRLGCRYCTLPSCFSPFRQRKVDLVISDIRKAASSVDFEQVGLITPEASDYGDLDALLDELASFDKGVSFASLRVDRLTNNIVKSMVRGGRHSITIAPESGNERLRASCGKNFSNERILEALQMAKAEGVTKAKLYFMIGLPGESEEDVLSIAALCERIRNETEMGLLITVAPFVPKPGTAWKDAPFEGAAALKSKYALLAKACKSVSRGVLQGVSIREAELEYALTWADSSQALKILSGNMTREFFCETDRAKTQEELRSLGLAR